MEQKKLPNVTISLILSILSFIACCFSWGIGGVLLSGIGLFLANKDKKVAEADGDPNSYENFGQLKTARIISIVGLVLGLLTFLLIIGMIIAFGGIAEMQEWQQEQLRQGGY